LINGQPAGNKCDFDSDDLSEGAYDIFLTVTDNEGAEDSVGASIIITSEITAENEPPIARITMTSGSETAYEDEMLELTVLSGGTANIHFSASRSTDPDGLISSYQWLINGQPAGNKCDFDSDDLSEGTYDIFLTVIDNEGAEDSVGASIIITSEITAENEPPIARITMKSGSKTAYEDQVLELTVPSGGTAKVDFSASRSSDPEGSISSYKWYIGGTFVSSSRDFSYNLGEGTCDIFLKDQLVHR
jgi:PKD repeat protein